MDDLHFMRQAMHLAELGRGQTRPNPAVGCLLVRDGRVVGLGSHLKAGGPHAEVIAVRQAGEAARGATAYVTLEPCCHHGRTPPCTDLLREVGVRRVVVATLDENPLVAGKGVSTLREEGIEVEIGPLGNEARRLNAGFFFFQRHGRPRVTLKAALSLDGKIATRTGDSRWISGPESRTDSHRLRHFHDAILVGSGTVISDNPRLTTRLPGGGISPLRVVLDRRLRIPAEAAILEPEAPTVVLTTDRADPENSALLRDRGVDVHSLGPELEIREVLTFLGTRRIQSVLVEGGATIHGAFLAAGAFDETIFYLAPVLIGGHSAPTAIGGEGFAQLTQAPRLVITSIDRLGNDLKITGTRPEEETCSPES